MTLKIASVSEYKELTELFIEIYDSVANKAQFNWPLENIQMELLISTFLLCRDLTGKLCGFISYRDNPDAIEIMALGTAAWARRKNVMAMLLAELKDYSRKASKPLILEVHSQNSSAINLYQKCGFQQVGIRKNYYSDRSDALTFRFFSEDNKIIS